MSSSLLLLFLTSSILTALQYSAIPLKGIVNQEQTVIFLCVITSLHLI